MAISWGVPLALAALVCLQMASAQVNHGLCEVPQLRLHVTI